MREQDIDSGVHRRTLRSVLRQLRESRGKTQSAVALEMSWSVSKLIRIESGSVSISVNDLRALLRSYDVTDGDRVTALVELAQLARRPSWLSGFRDVASEEYLAYIAYEEIAVRSYNFQPTIIPGLLQTEEYAAAILQTIRGPKNPSRIEKLVQLRIMRQDRIFSRENPYSLYFLLDESIVRRPVGSADIMRRQLEWLREMSERPNVMVDIIPFSAGFYRSIRVPFVLFEFSQPEDQAVLYLEYPNKAQIIREDVPVVDSDASAGPTSPPTYLEIFGELQQLTSHRLTDTILQDALNHLGENVHFERFSVNHKPWEREADAVLGEGTVTDGISVDVYVDTPDEDRAFQLLRRVDELVKAMGYGDPTEVNLRRGSLFRRSKAMAQQAISSEELRDRLSKVERGLELAGLELRQAQVDHGEAAAVSMLLAEIKDIPCACIRAGSVMLVKYTTGEGPVLLVRTLSQLEIRALDRYPEIQKNPEALLESLATAVDALKPTRPEIRESLE